jgi:hypothetical protein
VKKDRDEVARTNDLYSDSMSACDHREEGREKRVERRG